MSEIDIEYQAFRRLGIRGALVEERFTREFGADRVAFDAHYDINDVFDDPTKPFGYEVTDGPIACCPQLIAFQAAFLVDLDFSLYLDVIIEIVRELLNLREDTDRSPWDKLDLVDDIVRHASIRGFYVRKTVEDRGLDALLHRPIPASNED